MADVEITNTYHALSTNPERVGKEDVIVEYTIDGRAGRQIAVPADGFTVAKAQQAITEREREPAKAVGQKFTV